MPKVTFVKEKLELEVPQGANLREEAMKAGLEVYTGVNRYLNCFGHGTCGTCKVAVKKGAENLSPKGVMEKFTLWRMLSVIGHEQEARLSRQSQVSGDAPAQLRTRLHQGVPHVGAAVILRAAQNAHVDEMPVPAQAAVPLDACVRGEDHVRLVVLRQVFQEMRGRGRFPQELVHLPRTAVAHQ